MARELEFILNILGELVRNIIVAMLGLSLAACNALSAGSERSGVSASSRTSVAHSGVRKTAATAKDACGQAVQSQEGAAVLGAVLGAVGDYAPYSSRNGWAVRRAAHAGSRMAGVAESASAREAGRRC